MLDISLHECIQVNTLFPCFIICVNHMKTWRWESHENFPLILLRAIGIPQFTYSRSWCTSQSTKEYWNCLTWSRTPLVKYLGSRRDLARYLQHAHNQCREWKVPLLSFSATYIFCHTVLLPNIKVPPNSWITVDKLSTMVLVLKLELRAFLMFQAALFLIS